MRCLERIIASLLAVIHDGRLLAPLIVASETAGPSDERICGVGRWMVDVVVAVASLRIPAQTNVLKAREPREEKQVELQMDMSVVISMDCAWCGVSSSVEEIKLAR